MDWIREYTDSLHFDKYEYSMRDYVYNEVLENIYSEEKEWKKSVKKKHDEFVEEFTYENPDWVKERRVLGIKHKISEYNKEWIYLKNLEKEEDWIDEERNSFIVEKEINKLKKELLLWENPSSLYNENIIITQEDIDAAAAVDCGSIIEIHKKSGDIRWAICPFHEDRSPSLAIYKNERGFHCFSCGANGNAIHLARKIYGCDFINAVKMLINKY